MHRRILFLSHRVPYPPNRGDRIRAWHLLQGLAKLGTVHVGTLSHKGDDTGLADEFLSLTATHHVATDNPALATAAVQAMVSKRPVSLPAFRSRSLHRWIRRTLSEYQINTLFVFSGQMGQYIPSDFTGRIIVDLCDVDSAKFSQYASEAGGVKAILYEREARLLASEEARLIRRADVATLISMQERALLPPEVSDNVTILPNGVDTQYFEPSNVPPFGLAGDDAFVFVGQMDYPPNVAAVRRFANRILPRLRLTGDATFHIVGRSPVREVTVLGDLEGVVVWGEVADVRPFLAGAKAVVAPLDLARGIQNKVLEAMAMARPILLSPNAATGIGGKDGVHFQVCVDDDAFVAAASSLNDTGPAARRFVVQEMSWLAVHNQLVSLVEASPHARNVD